MIQIIWEFRVTAGCQEKFDQYYASSGAWASLFRESPEFWGTTLLADHNDPLRRITIDQWTDTEAFEAFKKGFYEEYNALNSICEPLKESETCLGIFEVV